MLGSIRLALYENPYLLHCQKYIPVMEYYTLSVVRSVQVLSFASHKVSVLTTQLEFRSQKETIANAQMNKHGMF